MSEYKGLTKHNVYTRLAEATQKIMEYEAYMGVLEERILDLPIPAWARHSYAYRRQLEALREFIRISCEWQGRAGSTFSEREP